MFRRNITKQMLFGLTAIAIFSLPLLAQGKQANLPDDTIRSIIERRIAKLEKKDVKVTVTVAEGVVTLSGTVPTLAAERQVAESTDGVDDIQQVVNNVTIAQTNLDDQAIADEVGKAIRNYALYDIFDWVDGRVVGGAVTLTGFAREPWRKSDYEKRVENVPGVRQIDNQIEVLPLSQTDDAIRAAAARAIYGYPGFERYANRALPPIHIIVKGNKVLLKGFVQTNVEKRIAENQVRTRVLCLGVTNELLTDADVKKLQR
jgi:hyperosmotically inducible periplasmic protein